MQITEKTYDWAYPLTPRSVTTHLVLHHAGASRATAAGIHAYHLSKGWAGIAYHYFVAKDGSVTRGRARGDCVASPRASVSNRRATRARRSRRVLSSARP